MALKKAFSDGTVGVDLDPLSLLSRLCASLPPPRFHTVRYAGVLGSASKLRSRLAPKCTPRAPPPGVEDVADVPRRSPYRGWAELLRRTFGFDVLACARCGGRMRLLATVTEPKSGYRATSELSVSRPKRPGERRRGALRSGRATSSEERPSATRPPSNATPPGAPREGSVRSPKTASPRGLRELRRGPSDLRRAGTPPLCILQPVAATPNYPRILA